MHPAAPTKEEKEVALAKMDREEAHSLLILAQGSSVSASSFLTFPSSKEGEIKVLIEIIQMRRKCQPALGPH